MFTVCPGALTQPPFKLSVPVVLFISSLAPSGLVFRERPAGQGPSAPDVENGVFRPQPPPYLFSIQAP